MARRVGLRRPRGPHPRPRTQPQFRASALASAQHAAPHEPGSPCPRLPRPAPYLQVCVRAREDLRRGGNRGCREGHRRSGTPLAFAATPVVVRPEPVPVALPLRDRRSPNPVGADGGTGADRRARPARRWLHLTGPRTCSAARRRRRPDRGRPRGGLPALARRAHLLASPGGGQFDLRSGPPAERSEGCRVARSHSPPTMREGAARVSAHAA